VGFDIVGFTPAQSQLDGHDLCPQSVHETTGRCIVKQARPRSVVCIGDSLVRGQVSVDFVGILRDRLADAGFHFFNAGVNGDLAYNVLTRLGVVTARQPDYAIVLVGTNDVNATLTPRIQTAYRMWKRLPEMPTPEWYRANMLQIVRLLKEKTSARIAITSPPVLGEDLASPANERIRRYSAILLTIAMQEGITYLPVHERHEEYLRRINAIPGRPHDANSLLMWTSLLRHYVLGHDFEAIATRNGFVLTTEGLHLNRQGAAIVADVVETFLRDTT
jgi:lysophospholipase L1-like esterase